MLCNCHSSVCLPIIMTCLADRAVFGAPRGVAAQTEEAGMSTSSRDNVLVVPNSAVIKQNDGSFVNVPGPDGPVPREHGPPMDTCLAWAYCGNRLTRRGRSA